MATIYKTDGTSVSIQPKNGKDFSLKEMQEIVDGYIEILDLNDGRIIVLNEEGKCNGLPYNHMATLMYRKAYNTLDFIVGDVLVCDSKQVK